MAKSLEVPVDHLSALNISLEPGLNIHIYIYILIIPIQEALPPCNVQVRCKKYPSFSQAMYRTVTIAIAFNTP